MEVTLAVTSSLLLLYSSPEHTLLLPPSTAHRPEAAPANDTAPWRQDRRYMLPLILQLFIKNLHVMNQVKLLQTYPQNHWCGHFGRSWREWWVRPYCWERLGKILRSSSFPPASDWAGWENYRRPWREGADPRWRMSSRTAGTGRSCGWKGFTWSPMLIIVQRMLKEWVLGAMTTTFPPHLMNLSITLSTHICILRTLNPNCQSMRNKLTMNQSLSSNVSSFPSKIAILDGTSFLWGIPKKKKKHILSQFQMYKTAYQQWLQLMCRVFNLGYCDSSHYLGGCPGHPQQAVGWPGRVVSLMKLTCSSFFFCFCTFNPSIAHMPHIHALLSWLTLMIGPLHCLFCVNF